MIENPFGSIWQFVDGININDNQAWVCADAEDYASNLFATPYEKLGYINADSNGYVKAMGFDRNHPFAELCVDPSGSSSTYYSDYYYQTTGQRAASVGGRWTPGPVCRSVVLALVPLVFERARDSRGPAS